MATKLDLALAGGDAIKPTEPTLDGRKFRFTAQWIGRANFWALTIRTIDGELLLAGIPVRVGQKLLAPHVDKRLPGNGHGELVAIDTSGAGLDPGRLDFGTRVQLVYVTAAEANAGLVEGST